MDQESKKWTRGNKYCIQNIKTLCQYRIWPWPTQI